MNRYRIVDITKNTITVEDTLGVRQRGQSFPKVEYFVDNPPVDAKVGDWVDLVLRFRPKDVSQK